MTKLDKLGRILNVILGITYVPLSLFSWLSQMVSEGTIGATNQSYIALVDIFCMVAFIIPLLCIAGIFVSVLLRRKGYSTLSFVIQFVPLLIFILNWVLLAFAETLPRFNS